MEANINNIPGGRYVRPFVIEGVMTREARIIRIIDGHYNAQFQVEDGGHISIDGNVYQLRYVDETHFSIGGKYWHICEFGECVIDKGAKVEKLEKGE
ncbi:MAG: hypothetical protein LBB60_00010 [Desulfovibrio sp.]|jgi:hypothetical protein|nr:hypothetical protein [Desulfovibrio sp.]